MSRVRSVASGALLLAIAVVLSGCLPLAASVYEDQSNQADIDQLKSDLVQAKVSVIEYAIAHDGSVAGATVLTLEDYDFVPAKTTQGFEIHVSELRQPLGFCLQASTPSAHVFRVRDDESVKDGACVEGVDY